MKKLNGFSLMEMMVVLLITAVVAAATAPLVGKRMITDAGNESPWFWLGLQKSIIYNLTGDANQNVNIGGKCPGISGVGTPRVFIKQGYNTSPQIALGRANSENKVKVSFLYYGDGMTSFSNIVPSSANSSAFGGVSSAGINGSAFGYGANASGNNSTAVGYGANASSNYAIAIGYGANATASGSVAIGSSVVVSNSNTISIGKSSDTVYIAGLKFSSSDGDFLRCPYCNALYSAGSQNCPACGRSVSSDRRLKNVGESFKGGLEEIKKLEVFNYVFKNDPQKTPRVGVMAQDLEKIFPNAVAKGSDGYLMIRMEDMFYSMVNAIKELDINIFDTNKRITALENKNKELEERIAKLENKSIKADKKSGAQVTKPVKNEVKPDKPKADKPKVEKPKAEKPKVEKPKEEKINSEEPMTEKPKAKVIKEGKKTENAEIKSDEEVQKPVRTEIKVKKHTEDTEVKTED